MGGKLADDLENVDLHQVERDYLLGRTFLINKRQIMFLILEMILVSFICLLPAAFIYGTRDFRRYNIWMVKAIRGDDQQLEFIRYSIFVAVAYSTFILMLIGTQIVPPLIIKVIEIFKGRYSFTARRHLHYAAGTESWIAIFCFFIAISFLSTRLLYDTSLLTSLGTSVGGVVPKIEGAILLERSYLLIVLFTFFMATSHYLLAVVRYKFQRSAFTKRIHVCNYKYRVLYRLFAALSRGIPSSKAKLESKKRSSTISLMPDMGMDLTSGKRTEEIADLLFDKLCPENREYLEEQSLQPYFDSSEVQKAFSVFNIQDTKTVDREEFREAVFQIHEERHAINCSLYCHHHIIRKLGRIFSAIAIILTLLFAVPLFNLQGASVIVIFGVVYGGLNFAIQAGLRGAYDSLHFIFIEHAFDVGDRVILSGESLIVEKIEIFTTTLRRADGTAAYIPNSNLIGAKIYNIRRSGNSCEVFPVALSSLEGVWKLRDKMEEFVKEQPREFTGMIDLNTMDIAATNNIKIELLIEYKGNFQSIAKMTARKNMIKKAIDELIKEIES